MQKQQSGLIRPAGAQLPQGAGPQAHHQRVNSGGSQQPLGLLEVGGRLHLQFASLQESPEHSAGLGLHLGH